MSTPLSDPVDLASSAVGGRVVYASDELFADRRHLIEPEPSAWQPGTYGPDGKIYAGWETRGRRGGARPAGGVARLRVLCDVVPDPRILTGTIDLAALWHGGRVVGASNMFYSSAGNLIRPGESRTIAEGWETARRRDGGHDWVQFALAGAGSVRRAEIDTTHFTGNAPGEVRLIGADAREDPLEDPSAWREVLPRTRLRPDTLHRFGICVEHRKPVTHIRMEVFPDGGMSRLRLLGELEPDALDDAMLRWLRALPESQLRAVLDDVPGLPDETVTALRARRSSLRQGGVPAAGRAPRRG